MREREGRQYPNVVGQKVAEIPIGEGSEAIVGTI